MTTTLDPRRRRGDYGIDGDFSVIPARWQAVIIAAIVAALIALTVRNIATGAFIGAVVTGLLTLGLVLFVGSYLYTTRVGKFEVWARILNDFRLRGDEQVLDLGCGRGALLLMAAELLPRGRTVGIDLWHADQTGNSPDATRRNAEREGVADRVEVETGDITQLPFADNTFDLIISNLVLHNIPSAAGRRAAIDEGVRVLRPGGRLAIADLWATDRHRARLHELGLTDLRRRNLGWRMWWGGPGFPPDSSRRPSRRCPSQAEALVCLSLDPMDEKSALRAGIIAVIQAAIGPVSEGHFGCKFRVSPGHAGQGGRHRGQP